MAQAIVMLKFEQIEPLGEWFAGRWEGVVRAKGAFRQADVVVPVPLHRNWQEARGFNQVVLFARPLARRLKVPFKPVLLRRTPPPGRRRICFVTRSAGKRYVALLP